MSHAKHEPWEKLLCQSWAAKLFNVIQGKKNFDSSIFDHYKDNGIAEILLHLCSMYRAFKLMLP